MCEAHTHQFVSLHWDPTGVDGAPLRLVDELHLGHGDGTHDVGPSAGTLLQLHMWHGRAVLDVYRDPRNHGGIPKCSPDVVVLNSPAIRCRRCIEDQEE